MTQNETKIHHDVAAYDIPLKNRTFASLRMSTCVSPRTLSRQHLASRNVLRRTTDSPMSPLSMSPRLRHESRQRIEALETLSKKVAEKSMIQRFQSGDKAFTLAAGDIFMKSSDILKIDQSDLNEISSVTKTCLENTFNDPFIASPKRTMTLSNILHHIAVTNTSTRTKQVTVTEINPIDLQSGKLRYSQGMVRNDSTQTPKGPLLSSRKGDHGDYRPNLHPQRTITSPKYPLKLRSSIKSSSYYNEHGYRKFKGSLRRPPSRNQVQGVLGTTRSDELSEKARLQVKDDVNGERDLKVSHATQKIIHAKLGTPIFGVSKAIKQLGLRGNTPFENKTQSMKGTAITGVSYQTLTEKTLEKELQSSVVPNGSSVERKEEKSSEALIHRAASDKLDRLTIDDSDLGQDDGASVATQDTGIFENEEDAFEEGLEGEMEFPTGSQVDFCPDDDDIDCVDHTAIGCLEDDDITTEAEEFSESARTSVLGDSQRNSIDETIIKPAIIKSVFSNCQPVINFGTKDEKVEPLPAHVRKLLHWKMSPITPIVVRNTIARSGFKPSKKSHDWIGYFGKHMKASGFRSLREYQKINHFPGSFQLGRKDRLWRNLSRMQAKFGKKEFGFVPQTFILPWDKKLLKSAWEDGGSKQKYIIKPPASARGIGIRLVHKWNQIPSRKPVLVQKYLSKPLLLNGFKFDIRLYVHVTSFDPLRIYLFDDGLVRFATTKYSTSSKHLSNRYMHLTNYSINKHSGDFQQNDDVNVCQGHKWSVKALFCHLQERGVDTDKIWQQFEDIVIKTLISVEQFTNSLVKSNCRRKSCCHELFGFDIMLDDHYQPWILEVNISPSLHSNSPLDVEIKGQMVSDMFNIAGFQLPDKGQITANAPSPAGSSTSSISTSSTFSQDKRKESLDVTCDTRVKHTYFAQHYKKFGESELMTMMLDVLTVNDIQMLVESEDENNRCGHFRRIFPGGAETRKYIHYFEQPRYYNALLHMWELKYANQKQKGILLLESYCRRGLHLLSSVTTNGRSIPMEHVWSTTRQTKIFSSPRTDPLPIVMKSAATLSSPCSTTSTAMTPFPGRISSATRWQTSSTRRLASVNPSEIKMHTFRNAK